MCFHDKKFSIVCLMVVSICFLTGCNGLQKESGSDMGNNTDSQANALVSSTSYSSDGSFNTSFQKSVSKNLPDSNSVEKSSSSFSENVSSTKSVTSKELTENYDNFKKTVEAMQADKISKIIMVEYVQGNGTAYSLENEGVIKRWFSIIKKLKYSSKPFKSAVGLGYEINVYEGGKRYYLGTWLDEWVYNITSNDTIIYIENYDELKSEIEQLKKDTKAYSKIVDLP